MLRDSRPRRGAGAGARPAGPSVRMLAPGRSPLRGEPARAPGRPLLRAPRCAFGAVLGRGARGRTAAARALPRPDGVRARTAGGRDPGARAARACRNRRSDARRRNHARAHGRPARDRAARRRAARPETGFLPRRKDRSADALGARGPSLRLCTSSEPAHSAAAPSRRRRARSSLSRARSRDRRCPAPSARSAPRAGSASPAG